MAFCLCRFVFQSIVHMWMVEIVLIDQLFARYSALFLSFLSYWQEHCQCSIILNYQMIELKSRTKSHMFAILFVAFVYNLFMIVFDPHRMAYRIN